MRLTVIAPLVLAWAVAGCGQATSDERRDPGGTPPDAGSGGAPPVTQAECAVVDGSLGERNAAELFEVTEVPTFDVFLAPERWAELRRNARDEELVEATACFEGRGLGRVGFRFKGAEGSLYSCFDENGNNTCKKLPLKLVFDELEEEKRFFGLKRLNFHSARYDETYLHERLAYDLFRSMDVVAPRASWAVVRVNGQVEGLFGMVEQVDGRFTADRFPERGDENLFKEVWPVNADEADLLEHLETNEETGDVSAFLAFAQAMDAAPEEELRTTLGEYTDLDYWARYMAVDDGIAAFDGITTFYTSRDGSWTSNHNVYFYEESPTLFKLIPWDEEATFVIDGFGQIPHWTTTPSDCALTYPVWSGGSLARAPGCDRVFRALSQDLDGYRREGRRLLDGPFSEAAMNDAIARHTSMLREHVARDPNGPGLARWEQAVGFLQREIPRLRLRLERLLAGESTVGLVIRVSDATDFEALDDASVSLGTWLGHNPQSTFTVSVNTASPLQGERDLLMSFEYADEVEPWQQWSSYRIPVEGGTFDARGLQGIRLWVRADGARTLRLDLDSPASLRATEGIRTGWDVPVSEAPQALELYFEDAVVPGWAGAPLDDREQILATLSGLAFFPLCAGRDPASGQLGAGVTDEGFVEIDDIELF